MRLRFTLIFPLAFLIYACATQARPLKPVRPTPLPTELFSLVDPDPLQVTFAQIEASPTAYLGQLLRVQGSYVALEPITCYPYQGPQLDWGLVADSLQMGARGYERVVELVPDGVPFTVDGVWRQYVGPSGCGKEPLSRVVYYLDVVDIVQPNPISRVYSDPVADVTPLLPTISSEGVVVVEEPTPTPEAVIDIATLPPNNNSTAYPVIIPTLTPSPSPILPTNTPRTIPTNTPRIVSTSTPRATVTPSSIDTSTPTPTVPTPTPTETPEPNDDATETPVVTSTAQTDATETPSPTPTATLFSRGTPTPTPEGGATATATTVAPPTETPAPTATGTPPTATPTSTGTITATPESEATATPNGSGLTTATPDPNVTPDNLPTPDGTSYPVPTSTSYPSE